MVAETATGDVPMVPFGAIRFEANAFVLDAAPAAAIQNAMRVFALRVASSGILSSRARVWLWRGPQQSDWLDITGEVSTLGAWRQLMTRHTTQARQLTFTPVVNARSGEVSGYRFEGPTRFDKLFTGIAVDAATWTKLLQGYLRVFKSEIEPVDPEDMPDADYGRLLNRAYEKSVNMFTSPAGTVRGCNYRFEGFAA